VLNKLRTQVSPVQRFTLSAANPDGAPTVDPGAAGAITWKHSSVVAVCAVAVPGVANARNKWTIANMVSFPSGSVTS
jgi:hypothetical protein